jgi:hypothetical protein
VKSPPMRSPICAYDHRCDPLRERAPQRRSLAKPHERRLIPSCRGFTGVLLQNPSGTSGKVSAGFAPSTCSGMFFICCSNRPAVQTAHPNAEQIEVQVDDRRREQRQELGDEQAAHDGVAKRLPQLRAVARAEH